MLLIKAIFEVLWMGRYILIPVSVILILSCVISVVSKRHSTGKSSDKPDRPDGNISRVASYNDDYVNYWMQYGGYLTEEQYRQATDIHG